MNRRNSNLVARLRPSLRRLEGRRVVAAVSGGSDSVGLLRVLHEAMGHGLLSVAHLDHGVRGEQSRGDAAFVGDLATSLGLPFDLGAWSPSRAGHFEADARKARYAWLLEVAGRRDASLIAVGHTRDDQAETVLHRVLRGTGPRGLAGIPARRKLSGSVTLIRPLLGVSRREIRDHLAAIPQDFREDATNADTSRTRGRIRHDLLPKLASEYNPRVIEALARLGSLAAQAERGRGLRLARLERLAIRGESEEGVEFRHPVIAALPEFLIAELLRRAWRRRGWPERDMDYDRWSAMASLATRLRGVAEIAPGLQLAKAGEWLRMTTNGNPHTHAEAVPLTVPGSAAYGDGVVTASLDVEDAEERVDRDCLALPLSVGPGDRSERFDPLGMGGHSQSLNDFLRGRGVPAPERSNATVVRDRRGIVWVVGHRIAERVKMTEGTVSRLGLDFAGPRP